MAQNRKRQVSAQPPARPALRGVSGRGKKIILAGGGVAVLGYFLLTKTDPAGQNIPSLLSPFFILGGYLLVGLGIILPSSSSNPEAQKSPNSPR